MGLRSKQKLKIEATWDIDHCEFIHPNAQFFILKTSHFVLFVTSIFSLKASVIYDLKIISFFFKNYTILRLTSSYRVNSQLIYLLFT